MSCMLAPGCALTFTLCLRFRPNSLIPFRIESPIIVIFFLVLFLSPDSLLLVALLISFSGAFNSLSLGTFFSLALSPFLSLGSLSCSLVFSVILMGHLLLPWSDVARVWGLPWLGLWFSKSLTIIKVCESLTIIKVCAYCYGLPMDAIILGFLCNRCQDTVGFLCMLCSVQHGLLLDFIILLWICRGYNKMATRKSE